MHIGIDARMMGKEVRGIGRYVERLLTHLAAQDTENHYTVFVRSSSAHLVPPNMESVIADIPWYGLHEQWKLPDVFRSRGLDLLHVPHWNAPVRSRLPLVMTIHDMILWERPTLGATTLSPILYAAKYLAYRQVVASNARRARMILSVSESARSAVIRTLGTAPEKIRVTPLGIDPLPEATLPEGVLAPYILNVGSGYPHKNLATYFHVVDQLMNDDPSLSAVACGIDRAFLPRITREAKKILVRNFPRLKLMSVVSDHHLGALYRNAKAFIYTSMDEGFGLPPLEAALAGVPVIASDINTARETLGNSVLLVPPKDINGFISAYKKLQSEPAFREGSIAEAKSRVHHFSWERTAKLTLAAYRDAISTP